MGNIRAIVNKVLVKTFYRQNAGFFLFLFIIFFGVVAPSQQLAYHYGLILGMLQSPLFLGIVALAWLLYADKTMRFVLSTLAQPESTFLYGNGINILSPDRLFRLCLGIQGRLLIPVWSYSIAVTGVAISHHKYPTALLVQIYMGILCVTGAACYQFRLIHPGREIFFLRRQLLFSLRRRKGRTSPPYWSILIRYGIKNEKALLAGLKLFSCGLLYLLLRDQIPGSGDQPTGDYDLRMPFLFYCLALLGHGMLLFRCRKFEDTRLLFFRTLPIPLLHRLGQYAWFHFLLLLPEMLLLVWLTPHPIRIWDTITFILSGYSVLLLMNSLLLIAPFTNRTFLKLCLGIFGILYCCVLGRSLIVLSGLFLVTATVLFFRGYARYERRA